MNPGNSKRAPSTRWIAVIVVASVILLPVMIFAAWRISISGRVNEKLLAAAKAGYPTNVVELEQMYYAGVPEEENAAVFFTEAFTHLPKAKGRKPLSDLWLSGNFHTNEAFLAATNRAQIAQILRDNAELLAILRKAPAGQKSRYPIKFSFGPGAQLPHLAPIKSCVLAILLDAAVQARDGNAEQAVQDLEGALRLSGSLSEEPLIISQLVRAGCRQYINSALECVLSRQRLTEKQLEELVRAVQQEENPRAIEHAMAGEQCLIIHYHQHPVAVSLASAQSSSNRDDDPPPSAAQLSKGFGIFKAVGLMDADLDYYLGVMSRKIAFAKSASPESIEGARKLSDEISNGPHPFYHFISDLMLPSLNKVQPRYATDVARLNLRLAALAVERYRLAHEDRLPGGLSELVPALLPAVPQDPFDGQPLRFKQSDKGYVIYSVGPDGTDDGGAEWQRRPRGATNDLPYDITFVVER